MPCAGTTRATLCALNSSMICAKWNLQPQGPQLPKSAGSFGFCSMASAVWFFNEFSLRWTRSRNLFDGPRMRYRSIPICERGPHVACTTGTSAASGARCGSHWSYRQRGTFIQVTSHVLWERTCGIAFEDVLNFCAADEIEPVEITNEYREDSRKALSFVFRLVEDFAS